MLIGYYIGTKFRKTGSDFKIVNKVMTFCISMLVFLMGIKMGSDEKVISNLKTIGLDAFIITVLLMAGAVISITIARKIMKIDRFGVIKGDSNFSDKITTEDGEGETNSNLMTMIIMFFVIIGLLSGYFIIRKTVEDLTEFNRISGIAMTVGLCFMLCVIGFGMGLTGKVVQQFKNMGYRVLVFPVAILIGTTAVAALCSIFMPLSLKETLAISYGFGWYTFAPIAITNKGYAIAGAISFMHNVFRELGGIVLIPLLAKKVGFIEVTGLPGVAAMDICMPIVEKTTRQDIIAYSFMIGMFESLMVPILVPLVIG